MMYHCIERTLDITHGDITVRLWVNLEAVALRNTEKLIALTRNYVEQYNSTGEKLEDFAAKLALIPNINAFQIVATRHDGVKVGMVFYTVPF